MGLQLTYQQEPDILCVQVTGQWTSGAMREAIGEAYAKADKHNFRLLLVDARSLSKPEDELTRFLAGVRWADLFDGTFRAAFLVTREVYNGFAETVARNRGANVTTFFDEAAARKWLK